MTYEEFCEHARKRPDSFAYYGELDMFGTWGFAPFGTHRDANLLEESNWETISEDLCARFPDSFEVVHTSHWLVGWYDHLAVRLSDHAAVDACIAWAEKLENYPVADEDDWSQRESEQAQEAYDNWARYDVGRMVVAAGIAALMPDGFYAPSDEQEDRIRELVYENIMDHNPSEGTYRDEDLLDDLREEFGAVPA